MTAIELFQRNGAHSIRAALLGLLLLSSGCVGIVPVPSLSNRLEAGKIVRSKDSSFIVPGQTTRREVEIRLGSDFRAIPRAPAIAYTWELASGSAYWWVFCQRKWNNGEIPFYRWHALFLVFDEKGIVQKKQFVKLSGRRSLDEQLERWAIRVLARHKSPSLMKTDNLIRSAGPTSAIVALKKPSTLSGILSKKKPT